MNWVVHKFGGASVKDADAVRNLGAIVLGCSAGEDRDCESAVVVSAMGKTTNALETVWSSLPHTADVGALIGPVMEAHQRTVDELDLPSDLLAADFYAFRELVQSWKGRPASDAGYDAIVGQGERWSTRIVATHLQALGLLALWVSAWDVVRTNGAHRAAVVDLAAVGDKVQERIEQWRGRIPVMQGFVGSSPDGQPTTLGREGSDFSGALLAEALQASKFIVWKDVPGVMTGDPRVWPAAEHVPRLDHGTAEILGKAGAGVLHRDTVAPIRRAGIPLEVRSFLNPESPGTRIAGETPPPELPPLWTISDVRAGIREVRCIGAPPDVASTLWAGCFPKLPLQSVGPDPHFSGCTLLLVLDKGQ